MKKGQLYRVCLKSSNFEDIPTFRIKIGKTEKKINPYFIPSDKQRYNCDSILERNNQQPELILSVFFGYKFIGSGSIRFDKPDMPNERAQIFNRDKQKIASIDCSLIKINKVVQVPALLVQIKTLVIDDLGPKDMTDLPYLVLKYGQLNYQTQKKPLYTSQGQFVFGQTFKFPESQMERIIVQIWSEIGRVQKFLGVCLIYLRQKQDINKQVKCEISYVSKKRGTSVIKISQDKQKQAKLKDYSNAPKRTIKTSVIEAVMLHPPKKGTYIRLTINKQVFETTSLFVQSKELRWNQAFTMQVNSEKQELIAQLCVKEQGLEHFGRAFLEISKVGNRTYELTLLDQHQTDIGKVYLQFYDHELNVKQRKTISKQLADRIGTDLQAIKNRYRSQQPLHQYLQGLHVILSEGMVIVSKQKPQNPLKALGEFLLSYKKDQKN